MKNNQTFANKPETAVSTHTKFKNIADDAITLQIFNLLEQNPQISQGKIKMQTGLAASLVHSFMKRIMEKGWVRARKVSAKRWLYFMTPEGFVEKSRLVMNYLGRTLDAYRQAQAVLREQLDICHRNGWSRIAVAGDTEFAAIAAMHINAAEGFSLAAVYSRSGAPLSGHNFKVLPYSDIEQASYDNLWVCCPDFIVWYLEKDVVLDEARVVNVINRISIPF